MSLTDFSIMFAPEEYGCDGTAVLRVTAYMNGSYVGTNTAMAPQPGTWPTGILTFHSAQGFNSVVVHYDSPPQGSCDWGPIFMADNLNVTPGGVTAAGDGIAPGALQLLSSPNPFAGQTTVRFEQIHSGPVTVTIHDPSGRVVRTLLAGTVCERGVRSVNWDGRGVDGSRVAHGIYLSRVMTDSRTASIRLLFLGTR